jgi:hypothetical protein
MTIDIGYFQFVKIYQYYTALAMEMTVAYRQK